jgi:hypothetical protein
VSEEKKSLKERLAKPKKGCCGVKIVPKEEAEKGSKK